MNIRQRIYDFIGDVLKINKKEDLSLRGSTESIAGFGGVSRNTYDLELIEQPVRSPNLAKQLIDLEQNSYIVQHTLWHASRDTFASADGDDQGFKICDTLKDGETPVNPEIKAIATELLNRKTFNHYVIGGERLKRGLETGLCMGDAFIEIAIEKEGIGRKDYCISDTLYLPTWEMFVVSTPQGQILQYEQRRTLTSKDPEYTFYPFKIIHMCYHQYRKYGRSLWQGNEMLETWKNLKNAKKALARGALELGYNPTVHKSPNFSKTQERTVYIDRHEQRKAKEIVTDLYLPSTMDVSKLANVNPDLKPLVDNVLHQMYSMIPAGYPTYYYPGLSANTNSSAKEISNQPALNYSRIRHDNCAFVASAAKQAIDLELVLKLGYERFLELQKEGGYRLEFPSWRVTPQQEDTSSGGQARDVREESAVMETRSEQERTETEEKSYTKIGNVIRI